MNKKILLADDSKTNLHIFKNQLKDEAYTIITASDGFEVMSILSAETDIDCIVASSTLSVYDGFQLARIIANSYEKKIATVVYAFEKSSVYEFWKDNTYTDVFVTIDDNDSLYLKKAIGEALKKKTQKMPQTYTDGATLSAQEMLKNSFKKDLFDLYVTKSTLEAGMYFNNMDALIFRMIKLLSGICGYDAVCLHINDTQLYTYTDILDDLPQSEIDDFLSVCKADFENRSIDNNILAQKHIVITPSFVVPRTIEQTKDSSSVHLKLKSYECFELIVDRFLGTIHLGHTKADYFTGRIHERCTFFVEKLTQLVDQLLYCRRLSTAEKTMRTAFSRFVPEQVITELIKSGDKWDDTLGENRKVAILISDIRNFTSISEINKPETVVSFLNDYFSIMCESIKKFGGSIDKFMGDAIMALFGAPVSYKDNGRRAALAALDMIEKLENLDTSSLIFPPNMKFDIGIGIHYGDVIVGSIGSKDKSDYTVIGDTVNLTSRLESLNKHYGTQIIISDTIRKELDNKFSTRLIDRVKVKGKSKSVAIYALEKPHTIINKEYEKNYTKAMEVYKTGAWSIASSYFEKALAICPDDIAARLLHKRCTSFIENPPENWDGAFSLTEK